MKPELNLNNEVRIEAIFSKVNNRKILELSKEGFKGQSSDHRLSLVHHYKENRKK